MIILGIESSCDETGVALVDAAVDGTPALLAHALHSQIDGRERAHASRFEKRRACAVDEIDRAIYSAA